MLDETIFANPFQRGQGTLLIAGNGSVSPCISPDRRSPPAERAHQADIDRSLSGSPAGKPADSNSGRHRQAGGLQVCEQWLPLWRALLRHQHESEELAFRIERMRDAIVGRLQLMYRPELSTLPEAGRKPVLIVLEALTDFESWGRLRERHRLSVEAACEIWIAAIDRILPPTPSES